MTSYTKNLNLLMKDPVEDGADTFNIETMLNENWEKIDKGVGNLDYDPAGSAADAVQQHNDSQDAHPYIRECMVTAAVQVSYNQEVS